MKKLLTCLLLLGLIFASFAQDKVYPKIGKYKNVKVTGITWKGIRIQPEGERSFSDLIIDTFFPRVPDTIEKFALETEKLGFNASINGDEYEIIFTKDLTGKLTVSSFEPVNK